MERDFLGGLHKNTETALLHTMRASACLRVFGCRPPVRWGTAIEVPCLLIPSCRGGVAPPALASPV